MPSSDTEAGSVGRQARATRWRIFWWGAALGSLVGLLVILGSALLPAWSSPSPAARPVPAGPGVPLSPVAVLDQDLLALDQDAELALPTEDPLAQAIRHSWIARYLRDDFHGALELIDANLVGRPRERELIALARGLVPREWVNDPDFPYPRGVQALYASPNGPERLSERWTVAETLVRQLPPGPQKVAILGRMELLATILGSIHQPPPRDIPAAAGLPALRAVPEPGPAPPARASDAGDPPTPLLDPQSVIPRLRALQADTIRAIRDLRSPHDLPSWLIAAAGWLAAPLKFLAGLALFGGLGALIAQGVLLKLTDIVTESVARSPRTHALLEKALNRIATRLPHRAPSPAAAPPSETLPPPGTELDDARA